MVLEMFAKHCPFCGSPLYGNLATPCCTNSKCEFGQQAIPRQYIDNLITYKSALDVALDALNQCKTREHIGAVCRTPKFVDDKVKEINDILSDADDIIIK